MDYKKINDEFYSSNYWTIDRSRYKWFSKYVKAKIIKKFIKSLKNKEVLYDAGGGVGNWGSYFIKDFKKIIVSDISKIALKKIPEKEIVRVQCNVLKNKLPSKSVDCIILMDVFEHIDEKDLLTMMKDFKRILKKEGRILIYTSLRGWGFGSIRQRIFNSKKRLLGNEHEEGHVNRLTYDEFKELFEKSSLNIDDYYFYSIFFQQFTDAIKDRFARFSSHLLGKEREDKAIGRAGQSIKENLRKKEERNIFKIPFFVLSWVSYLDILLFGKLIKGNSIFLSLKVEENQI